VTPPRAALLLTTAALAACGGDGPEAAPAPPVRVQVVHAAVDAGGPVDGFSLVAEDGRSFPLAPRPDSERTVLAAAAPGGRYRVAGPLGWAPVGPLDPLALRGDLPPSPLWVGRLHTVYLLHPPELPVTEVEAAQGEGEPLPLAARLETGSDGRSALRVPPSQWHGTVTLRARLGATHFAKAVRLRLEEDGAPRFATAEPALVTTFDVLALPPEGRPAAGVEVAGVSRLGGLETRTVARTNASGWARLDPVPVDAGAFRLEARLAGGVPASWPAEALRRLGEARLLVPDPRPGEERATLLVPSKTEEARVQVRAEGSDTYAVATGAWETNGAEGRALQVSLPPGRWRWIAQDPAAGTSREGTVDLAAGTPVSVPPEPARADAVLSVSLRGAFDPRVARHDVFARRLEDGAEVTVVGGTLRGLMRRDADLTLPPGTWRVRLAVGAREGPPKDVDLSAPGTRASLDLEAPR
jgi:hypothetical protein